MLCPAEGRSSLVTWCKRSACGNTIHDVLQELSPSANCHNFGWESGLFALHGMRTHVRYFKHVLPPMRVLFTDLCTICRVRAQSCCASFSVQQASSRFWRQTPQCSRRPLDCRALRRCSSSTRAGSFPCATRSCTLVRLSICCLIPLVVLCC